MTRNDEHTIKNSLKYWSDEIFSSAISFCNACAGLPYEEEFYVNAVYRSIKKHLKTTEYNDVLLRKAATRAKLRHHRIRKSYIRWYLNKKFKFNQKEKR